MKEKVLNTCQNNCCNNHGSMRIFCFLKTRMWTWKSALPVFQADRRRNFCLHGVSCEEELWEWLASQPTGRPRRVNDSIVNQGDDTLHSRSLGSPSNHRIVFYASDFFHAHCSQLAWRKSVHRNCVYFGTQAWGPSHRQGHYPHTSFECRGCFRLAFSLHGSPGTVLIGVWQKAKGNSEESSPGTAMWDTRLNTCSLPTHFRNTW